MVLAVTYTLLVWWVTEDPEAHDSGEGAGGDPRGRMTGFNPRA